MRNKVRSVANTNNNLTRWFQVMGFPRWGGHCLTVIYSNIVPSNIKLSTKYLRSHPSKHIRTKNNLKSFPIPPRAIKRQLTCPIELTSGSFRFGRRGILVIPRNRLVITIVFCKFGDENENSPGKVELRWGKITGSDNKQDLLTFFWEDKLYNLYNITNSFRQFGIILKTH